MELMFPAAIFIGIPIAVILTFFTFKRKDAFRKGKKVANTNFIKETPLFRKLMKEYKCYRILSLISLWLALILAIIMLARPVMVEVRSTELQNRDIFICMDISDSVDQLNLDICGEIKEVVKELNGERFGITIFNGRSVLLVPLTTDYDYVLETLDKLEASFEYSLGNELYISSTGEILWDEYGLYQFKYEGTLWDDGRGSSFIGDGLASCLYNFPDLKENTDRSRLIIFTTDNELNEITASSFVSLEEAAALCTANGVKVFAVTPENIIDEEIFHHAILNTGGKHYEVTSSKVFDELVDDIRLTGTSVFTNTQILITDKPELLFIGLLIFVSMHFIFNRKIKG